MDDESEVMSSGGTNGRAVLVARLHGAIWMRFRIERSVRGKCQGGMRCP